MSAAALLVTIGNRDCVVLICSVGTLVHCAFSIGIGRVWTVSVRSAFLSMFEPTISVV